MNIIPDKEQQLDQVERIPNKETIEAMQELERGEGKLYSDINDFFKEIDSDDED